MNEQMAPAFGRVGCRDNVNQSKMEYFFFFFIFRSFHFSYSFLAWKIEHEKRLGEHKFAVSQRESFARLCAASDRIEMPEFHGRQFYDFLNGHGVDGVTLSGDKTKA